MTLYMGLNGHLHELLVVMNNNIYVAHSLMLVFDKVLSGTKISEQT